MHDEVHFAGSEGEQDLTCALPELDVLTFTSPVALEGDTTGLASVRTDIGLVADTACQLKQSAAADARARRSPRIKGQR